MKTFRLSHVVFFALVVMISVFSTRIMAVENTEKPIRMLLVVGGHGYDQENLFRMLEDMPNSSFKTIEIPQDQDLLKPGLANDYDVLIFHDQSFFELTEEQKANMEALWTEGMPTVMLHHALISHNDVPLFREVYGAAYCAQEMEIDGRIRPASTYLKPATFTVYIVDQKHPITQGLSDFTLNDEVFGNLYFNPKVNVLATTDHPESSVPIVWTWHYKNTPVFGVIPGDNGGAFNDPNYREIFYRGVRWAVQEMNQ